jgi:hypothetical protein
MPSSGMLRRVALVRTDVSEERIASVIRVTKIGELGTSLAVTGNRNTVRWVGKKIEILSPKRRFTYGLQGYIYQQMAALYSRSCLSVRSKKLLRGEIASLQHYE